MTIAGVNFQNVSEADQLFDSLTQAAATNMGRFTVRQDFMPEIGDYLYRNAPFWARLPKEPAEADIIKEIRMTQLPAVGFSAKSTLNTVAGQGGLTNRQDLTDPGQEVKCVSGFIDWSHYARSLYEQQGRPYGDQVARDTNDMIDAATMLLELGLFTGNATSDALQFNGIPQLMPTSNHVFTLDITATTPETSLSQKLVECCTRIMSNRVTNHRITDIITTGAGWNLIQREIEEKRLFTQLVEVIPGVQVPAILTPWGKVPISMTPFLSDTAGANTDPDTINFWFIDINKLVWKGVVPLGGAQTFDPQIFEITTFANNVPLTEKRMILCYGVLYAKNRGADIYRLDVTAPRGSAWTYTTAN
jgi:hypothetical protein